MNKPIKKEILQLAKSICKQNLNIYPIEKYHTVTDLQEWLYSEFGVWVISLGFLDEEDGRIFEDSCYWNEEQDSLFKDKYIPSIHDDPYEAIESGCFKAMEIIKESK